MVQAHLPAQCTPFKKVRQEAGCKDKAGSLSSHTGLGKGLIPLRYKEMGLPEAKVIWIREKGTFCTTEGKVSATAQGVGL